MAITNFDSLKTAVASNLHREQDIALLTEMPRFIQMAEFEIFRELPLRQLETSISGTTTGPTIALPVGTSAIERIAITAHSRDYSLDYSSPNGISYLTTTDRPTRFNVENDMIRLISPPDTAYSYTLYIIPNLVGLSATNQTNWIITNAPDVYFYATTIQAATWTRDTDMVAEYIPLFQRAVDSVKRKDERKRFPISGGLQIKPRGYR